LFAPPEKENADQRNPQRIGLINNESIGLTMEEQQPRFSKVAVLSVFDKRRRII